MKKLIKAATICLLLCSCGSKANMSPNQKSIGLFNAAGVAELAIGSTAFLGIMTPGYLKKDPLKTQMILISFVPIITGMGLFFYYQNEYIKYKK